MLLHPAPRVRTRKCGMKSVCSFRCTEVESGRLVLYRDVLRKIHVSLIARTHEVIHIGANGDIQPQRYGRWMVSHCVNIGNRAFVTVYSVTHFSTF
jgi:hypothetical protein